MKHDSRPKERLDKFSQPVLETNVGPGQYQNIKYVNHVEKSVVIGTSGRAKCKEHLYKPAPNAYFIPGDFDFKSKDKDPNATEKEEDFQMGKYPKFHFGMNNKTRDKNLDMPGPGEYDMNVYPSY